MKRTASTYERELDSYVLQERAAVKLAHSVGQLLYEKGVDLVLFRKKLSDTTVSEILKYHVYAKNVVRRTIDVFTTSSLADNLQMLPLAPCKLDIGKLAVEWEDEKDSYRSQMDFLQNKLKSFSESCQFEPRDVVVYGFGRIGRLVARDLVENTGKGVQLRLKAIVTRDVKPEFILKRAALLRNDSVHGEFKGLIEVDVDNQLLVVNGQIIQFIHSKSPETIDYTSYGIDKALVIDSTGANTTKETLSQHLKAKGVAKVLLTAPGKEVPNCVYGINETMWDKDEENIWSAASCTTNAISPILKVITDYYGVEKGHIETIHAYTNDQNLLDNFHKKQRRGRSAAINMVITETGAARAVVKVIPELIEKLTANAVRVPTPNASLAILNLTLEKETDLEEVKEVIRKASTAGPLVNQIFYSIEPELVSKDIVGNTCCSVFDSTATIVSPTDKKNVILYVWYDNEFGYTKQVLRLARHISGVRRPVYTY